MLQLVEIKPLGRLFLSWTRTRNPQVNSGEVFNALNHASYGPPVANIRSAAFGTITTTVGNPRIVPLVLKYYF
jgi:hypothetical protein